MFTEKGLTLTSSLQHGFCSSQKLHNNIVCQHFKTLSRQVMTIWPFSVTLTCFFSPSLSSTQDNTKSILRTPSLKNTVSLLGSSLSVCRRNNHKVELLALKHWEAKHTSTLDRYRQKQIKLTQACTHTTGYIKSTEEIYPPESQRKKYFDIKLKSYLKIIQMT